MDGCVCACLPRVLHLGEVEEGAEVGALAGAEGGVAVEEVEAEVDEAADGRLAVDEDVRLGEVPAARPHEERRGAVAEPVLPPSRRVAVGDRAGNRVAQVHLPAHQVLPRRRQRVLEVSLAPTITTTSRSRHVKILTDGAPELCAAYHEDLGAGVEGVDDHLARLGGAGDLDGAVGDGRRHGGARPAACLADGPRGRVEPGELAGVVPPLRLPPALHGVPDGAAELALQAGHEGQRVAGEDGRELRVVPAEDVHALRRVVARARRRCGVGGHGVSRVEFVRAPIPSVSRKWECAESVLPSVV